MSLVIHKHMVGDTLTPLGFRLRRRDPGGQWESPNLTGFTVKFRMVAEDGTVIVNDSTTGISLTDAAAGEGQYDFQANDVKDPGTFYAWIRVENPATNERDTYPVGRRKFVIVISDAA